MHATDGANHVANEFVDGDPGVPTIGTRVEKHWLNAVQAELLAVLAGGSITPVKGTNTQVLEALVKMFIRTGATPSYGANLTNGLLFESRTGDGGTDGGGLFRIILKDNSAGEDSQLWITLNAAWDGTVPQWVKDGTGTSLAIKFRSIGMAGVGHGEISFLHHGIAGGTFNESAWATRGNTLALPLIKRETVTAPTLINSWSNVGTGRKPAGYWVDVLGVCRLEGSITGGTTGSVAFVLPAAARPSAVVQFAITGDNLHATVTINTSGDVTIIGTSLGVVALDGVNFGT